MGGRVCSTEWVRIEGAPAIVLTITVTIMVGRYVSFPPIAATRKGCDVAIMKAVRRPWLIFGLLLTCGIVAFSVSADWSAQSWLDVAALVVSVVGVLGVLTYATSRAPVRAAFWGAFRWIFIVIVAAQVFVHAIETAKRHGYSEAGTVAFVVVAALIMGWIFALQWVAMTRLARERY